MRKLEVWMCSVVAGTVLAWTGVAQAEPIGGVEFPGGAASFADRVVDFAIAANVSGAYDDPASVLGVPDADTALEPMFSLGNATSSVSTGFVVVEFVDNRLVDVPGNDLYIFESGPEVEDTLVSISRDGTTWYELGRITGGTRAIDLAAFPSVPASTLFRYVRLTDYPNGSTSGSPYAGPDIDAIGAIGADVSDGDDDGVHDDGDNCVTDSNPGQENQDADPLGDVCDVCPTEPGMTELEGCPSIGAGGAGGADGAAGEAGAPSAGSAGEGHGGEAGAESAEGGAAGEPGGAGGEGGDEAAGEAGAAAAGRGGSAPSGSGGTGANGGSATRGGNGGTGGSQAQAGDSGSDDAGTDSDSGCGCRVAGSTSRTGSLAALLLAVGAVAAFARRRTLRAR